MTCPHASGDRDEQIKRLDHWAYVANRRGDRCGWVLLCALAGHIRDVRWDRMPWLRDDACRLDLPGNDVVTRSGRRIPG